MAFVRCRSAHRAFASPRIHVHTSTYASIHSASFAASFWCGRGFTHTQIHISIGTRRQWEKRCKNLIRVLKSRTAVGHSSLSHDSVAYPGVVSCLVLVGIGIGPGRLYNNYTVTVLCILLNCTSFICFVLRSVLFLTFSHPSDREVFLSFCLFFFLLPFFSSFSFSSLFFIFWKLVGTFPSPPP